MVETIIIIIVLSTTYSQPSNRVYLVKASGSRYKDNNRYHNNLSWNNEKKKKMVWNTFSLRFFFVLSPYPIQPFSSATATGSVQFMSIFYTEILWSNWAIARYIHVFGNNLVLWLSFHNNEKMRTLHTNLIFQITNHSFAFFFFCRFFYDGKCEISLFSFPFVFIWFMHFNCELLLFAINRILKMLYLNEFQHIINSPKHLKGFEIIATLVFLPFDFRKNTRLNVNRLHPDLNLSIVKN